MTYKREMERLIKRNTAIVLLWHAFKTKVDEKVRSGRFQWASFLLIIRIKRRLVKTTGKNTIEERDRDRIRDAMSHNISWMKDSINNNAGEGILNFMRKTGWRYELKNICVTYVHTVKGI